MNQKQREDILEKMVEIGEKVDRNLDTKVQQRGNMAYYKDFEFKGSALAVKNVNVVEISNQKIKQTGDKEGKKSRTYEIYSEKGKLIATVSEEGKVHFTQEYLEQLRNIDKNYFEQLYLEDIDFELPEELSEYDVIVTKEEIEEHSRKELDRKKDGTKENDTENERDEQEEKEVEQEDEERKKEKTAEALGIEVSEVNSVCTINPQEKITDKYNLIDIMPEAAGYQEISIIYSGANGKSHGQFTVLGVTKNGTREIINSIEPVEGTSTSKNVISVNEDGSEVTEKQVKGLFRINSRNRNDGISVSIGDYGMIDVDYVSNIMDKETRRATPIRTKEVENQRIATHEVRENAGDSLQEMEKEGKIFREREKEGVNPQSLDGIDVDQANGESITVEQLKKQIKEKFLKQEDMSRGEMKEFIRAEIIKSGLELSEEEINIITQEIQIEVLDESRFPTRENRI